MSKRITGFVNWKRKRQFELSRALLDSVIEDAKSLNPDHFALTGDIVNLATEDEIDAATQWLDSLAMPEKISLICGNHDAYVKGALDYISSRWTRYLDGDNQAFSNALPVKGWEQFSELYPVVQRRGPMAFVGVSTAIPTRPFRATGLASTAQLNRLKITLSQLKDEGLCRVVMLHHPPQPKATDRHKRLVAAHEFRNVIKQAGAELILHGHTHLETITQIAGPIGTVPVICVPATGQLPGQAKPAGRHNLFEVETTTDSWVISMTARGIAANANPDGPFEVSEIFRRNFEISRPV